MSCACRASIHDYTGILIFLTGENEIAGVCRKPEAKFGRKVIEERKRRRGQMQRRWDIFFNTPYHTIHVNIEAYAAHVVKDYTNKAKTDMFLSLSER